MTATELLHLPSSQEEADAKLVLHAPKILKESSSNGILLLNLAHMYEYKERIYISNSHEQYKKI